MNKDELRTRMADYLDGLLEEGEARAVEEWIAREPGLLAEVAHLRAVLYRPYPVPPPRAEQEERILARFRERPLILRLVRYAAVFLAGVLATLAFQLSADKPVAPRPDPQVENSKPAPTVIGRRVLR